MLPPQNTYWFGLEPVEEMPLKIGSLTIEITEKPNNPGTRLWPCSVVMAEKLLNYGWVNLKVCEVGAGLGVPGIVVSNAQAQVTFIDKSKVVTEWLRMQLFRNKVQGSVKTKDWNELTEGFDSIIGSEIIYDYYKPNTLVDFVNRSWNEKANCFFAFTGFGEAKTFIKLCEEKFNTTILYFDVQHEDGRPFAFSIVKLTSKIK